MEVVHGRSGWRREQPRRESRYVSPDASPFPVEIRPEVPGDFDAIAALVEAAFGSSVEAGLVNAIRASPEYIPELALVAIVDGEVVGHVMISDAAIEHDGARRRIAMLSPLAVLPESQRRGIGAALVLGVVARADTRGEPLVILEGDPSYYGRLGFVAATPLGISIPIPDWAPPEAAQCILLRAYDPAIRGQVVYPAAFEDLPDR